MFELQYHKKRENNKKALCCSSIYLGKLLLNISNKLQNNFLFLNYLLNQVSSKRDEQRVK
jgi:hypothetical protein